MKKTFFVLFSGISLFCMEDLLQEMDVQLQQLNFFTVCSTGKTEQVTSAIKGAPDFIEQTVHMRNDAGKSPLSVLYGSNKSDLALMLFIKQAQVVGTYDFPVDERGNRFIHLLAARDDTKLVDSLTDFPLSLVVPNGVGDSPAHGAARAGALQFLRKLAGRQVPLHSFNSDGETPLLLATDQRVIDFLVGKGVSLGSRTDSLAFLMRSIEQNAPARFTRVCDARRLTNKEVLTLLFQAVRCLNTDIISYLCSDERENGVREIINLQNEDEDTLIYALVCVPEPDGVRKELTRKTKKELFDLFRKLGARVDMVNKKKNTLLHGCALSGCTPLALELIKEKLRVNQQNAEGDTALHIGASGDHDELGLALLENGASAFAKNDLEDSPFHIAIRRSRLELVRAMISHWKISTIFISTRNFLNLFSTMMPINRRGHTLMHEACLAGHSEIFSALETHLNGVVLLPYILPDREGNLPIHLATMRGNQDMVKRLWFPLTKNNAGETCLHIAAALGYQQLLIELVHRLAKDLLAQTKKFLSIGKARVAFMFDNLNQTPFHKAAYAGQWATLRYLLSQDAAIFAEYIDCRDLTRRTAIEIAREIALQNFSPESSEFLQFLEKRDPAVNLVVQEFEPADVEDELPQ